MKKKKIIGFRCQIRFSLEALYSGGGKPSRAATPPVSHPKIVLPNKLNQVHFFFPGNSSHPPPRVSHFRFPKKCFTGVITVFEDFHKSS